MDRAAVGAGVRFKPWRGSQAPSWSRRKHALRVADVQLARCINLDASNHQVIGQQGIALRTAAHSPGRAVLGEPQGIGEGAVAVRDHGHLALHREGLAPGVHHEGIVHRHTEDFVHALGKQLRGCRQISGHMALRTGWSERTRQAEDHHPFACAARVQRKRLRAYRTGIVPLAVLMEGRFRQQITGFDHGGLQRLNMWNASRRA